MELVRFKTDLIRPRIVRFSSSAPPDVESIVLKKMTKNIDRVVTENPVGLATVDVHVKIFEERLETLNGFALSAIGQSLVNVFAQDNRCSSKLPL